MKMTSIPFILFTILQACVGISESDNQNTFAPIDTEQISKADTIINFETINGFTQTFTGTKQKLNWQLVSESGNKVVAQLAKNEGDYYNLLVLDKLSYKNISITGKIKAVSGEEDQGGGLVWRYIDKDNYYIARYNPLENNFRLYRVVDGSRKQMESVDSDIKQGEWFTMTIEMKGNKITCSLNGKKLIEATDDTFKSAGLVGFWTKADAVTYFDDLTIISRK